MPEPVHPGLTNWLDSDPAELEAALRASGDADGAIERWIAECRPMTLSDPERGVSASAKLAQLAQRTASARVRARSLSAQGHALSYAGQMKQALAVTEQAIGEAERSGDRLALAEACMTAVQSHNVLGLRGEALELASRAGAIFEELGDRDRSATAVMLAGVVLRMMDRPEEALSRFDAALRILGPSPSLRAQLSSNRAEALLDLGRFAQAKAAFELAAEGFRACEQDFGVAIVEGNLADLASRRGELREALRLFLAASDRFRAANDEAEAARLEAEAAELFLAIGDHREPLFRLPKSIESLRAAGMQTELARALAALGVALGRTGDLDAALDALAQSERQSREHNQPQAAARALALRGRVLQGANRLQESAEALRRSLGENPLPPARARTLLDLALTLSESGDPVGAQSALDEAADIAQRLSLADTETVMRSAEARLARFAGNLSKARKNIDAALDSAERRRNLFAGDRLRATAQDGVRLAADEGVLLALQTADPAFAFEVAERSLASAAESRSAPTHQPTDRAALEGDIAATLAQIEDARAAGRDPSAILRLRERLRLLELQLASRSLRDESQALVNAKARSTPSLRDFQSALPARVLAVSFLRAGRGFARLAITREAARLDEIPLTTADAAARSARLLSDIDRALVRLTMGRSVSPELDGRIAGELAALGSSLLGGLESELQDAERLVVVLPPELSRLPLPALSVDGSPLVTRCSPTLAPSLTWALRHAHQPRTHRKSTLVVGVADEFAPSIEAEAQTIASVVTGAMLLFGKEATLERVKQVSPDCARLHLACHGEYSPADPMGSRVRFADGWVSGRTFADLDFRGTEVVLSGCETGTSESISGEWFGLVRSCMQAGARSLVASHWRLADAAASEMFSELYTDLLASGVSLPVALARVQAKSAHSAVNPALWGGLFAIGSWT